MLLDSTDDHRAVRVAYLLCDNADGIWALQAQGAREKIRAVLQLGCRRQNPLLRVFRDGARRRRIIQRRGHRSGSQLQMLRNRLQGDSFRFTDSRLHRARSLHWQRLDVTSCTTAFSILNYAARSALFPANQRHAGFRSIPASQDFTADNDAIKQLCQITAEAGPLSAA